MTGTVAVAVVENPDRKAGVASGSDLLDAPKAVDESAPMRTLLGVLLVVGGVGAAGVAAADRSTGTKSVRTTERSVGVPKLMFLNRCVGGCTVTRGDEDDARAGISTIPQLSGPHQITEFSLGDTVWNDVVTCMREAWSPYGITFTETRPAATELYSEAVIAGRGGQVDVDEEFAGFAPLDEFCRSLTYAISYTFANQWVDYNLGADTAVDICRVASQEIAHTYGLDHIYQFLEGDSSCSDPMTYRFDCGGQKFFRNRSAVCGEAAARPCNCGPVQQSHSFLINILKAGTPITTTDVEITAPADGATITNGSSIVASGFSQRGVVEVAFRLNGYPWGTLPGVPFGNNGQSRASYSFTLPADVPDGVIDIEVEARDDIGVSSTSIVTVTKGAPCVTEDSCAAGQACDAGRCIWPAPVGEVGEACAYPQFCVEPRCDTHAGESFCTRECVAGLDDACGDGLDCLDDPAGAYCWPAAESGGCCSSSRELPWGVLVIGGIVLLISCRRRTV